MQIALLGGTGDVGQGLALRWASDTDHEVFIGSRKEEKARSKAQEYATTLAGRDVDAAIEGYNNPEAAARGDVVVLSVPAYHLSDTIDSVAYDIGEAVLVSPAIGMQRDDAGIHYNPPAAGSVTELAASAAPDDVPVVGAFHSLAAGTLADLDADLNWDVPIVGDDPEAKKTICELTNDIDGIRAVDAGGLANAAEVETLTPLLINLAAHNENLHDLGVKFQ
jgi:NADPH-dependent F420 reductase